jgi:hypothetical protein
MSTGDGHITNERLAKGFGCALRAQEGSLVNCAPDHRHLAQSPSRQCSADMSAQ